MPVATMQIDLEITLREVSKTDKDIYDITYLGNLKKMTEINLFMKQKQTHRLRRQMYGY